MARRVRVQRHGHLERLPRGFEYGLHLGWVGVGGDIQRRMAEVGVNWRGLRSGVDGRLPLSKYDLLGK